MSFETTHWSVILAAGDAENPHSKQALSSLLQTYWSAVFAMLRRNSKSDHEAEDLTQAFFLHFLEKQIAAVADPDRGRFRAFLRSAVGNFLKNQWAREAALKRGGGKKRVSLQPRAILEEISDSSQLSPEQAFDRQWAVALLNRALCTLRDDYEQRGNVDTFDRLKDAIVPNNASRSYQELAEELETSEGAVKALIFRMRRKFRLLLEMEVAQTVVQVEQIDDEIQVLFDALSGN